ncbi:MAG: PAS domain S-box protein, partial [Chloroflexota bacterium]
MPTGLGRLLIVDDEAELMSALVETLTEQGYEAEGFTAGQAALQILDEQDFDLLLVDLMMPGLDGIALLRAALEIDPHLVGLIMTGHGTVQTAVEAMKVGAFDYILKPFKLNALLPILARAMQMRRLRLENMQLRETVAIYELSQAIAFTLDLNTILNKVVEAVAQQGRADYVSILLPAPGGQELYLAAGRGDEVEQLLGQRLSVEQGMEGWVARHHEPLLRDTSICIPILAGGRLEGVLKVKATRRRRPFTLGEVKALNILTNIAAPALENARLYTRVRAAEEKYRSIFENAVEGIFQLELDGRVRAANPALARILGYASPEELMADSAENGAGWWTDPTRLAELQQQLKTQDYLQGLEFQSRCRDGRLIWVSENVRAVRDPGGNLLYYEGLLEDITERKEVEETIHRRNRELAMLNQIISASAAALEPEAILQTACRELALAFDLPQAVATLVNEAKTGFTVVVEYRAGDESRSSMLGHVFPIEAGSEINYMLNHKKPLVADDAPNDPRLEPARDLVRRRGAASLLIMPLSIEDELVGTLALDSLEPHRFSSEEVNLAWSVADQVAGALARARLISTQLRLSAAVEQAAEIIMMTNTDGTIIYVNPAFERVSGYSRAEVIGRNPRLLKSGQHDQAFYQNLWATISAGQVWRGRIVNKRKNGGLYTGEATITPVHDAGGTIVNFVAVIRDVTHELRLEEQFRQAQKMEAVGRLAGGVAHDFNNLLTVINGYSEILLNRKLEAGDPLRRDIEQIRQAGERAIRLTGQLLAFSRKQIMQVEVLDLNSIVVEMDRLLGRMIGEDINIETHLHPGLGRVKADRGQLEQVMMNLAVNARDAMPNGGALIFETANVVLDQAYARQRLEVEPGSYVLLAVSDTGTGMDRQTLNHIFEPFFTTKTQGKGTGLGLATVHGIVKQSGGHIEVYSEVGHGTTFKIYLPRLEEEAEPLEPALVRAESLRGSETVLVVEDEVWVRELVGFILRDFGYTVLEATHGAEALQLCAERPEPIHLLLTDVVMPDMSGRELARQLKLSRPPLKVLYMSGYTDDAIVHHGVLDEGVAFIQKP